MIKILVAGDFFPHSRVARLVENKKYEEILGAVRPLIKNADYSIVNLESPVVIGPGKPIKKQGPNLRCTANAVEALKYIGFNMVTLANNHFYDYGDEGVYNTMATCREYGLDMVGGGVNLHDAEKIIYTVINGKKFGFVNFCEHEFSIATNKNGGSNPMNPVVNHYHIKEARKFADYVIVIVHGGHEHYQLPSPRMKETYRFFINSGADSVVNYHQHCYSGYEVYKCKPIFYGLGNFCFDKEGERNGTWNKGFLVHLFFDSTKIDFELFPYTQGEENPGVELLQDSAEFNRTVNHLNNIIDDDEKLNNALDEYVRSNLKEICLAFEPYTNHYLKALRRRNFIPSFLHQKRLIEIVNLIECEAHRDILVSGLYKLINEKNSA
jgi:poly-gamma-glutamate capsule biosynthesis protein CapA/YwtB (metallophosphatase superfamily)